MAAVMLTNPSTSKDLSETVDDLTICSICIDTLKNPKYFSCLHTFCLSCVQGYLDSAFIDKIPKHVSCPVCRTKIRVPDSINSAEDWSRKLPINHIIMSLIDAKKMQSGKRHACLPCKKLDSSKEQSAKYFCTECKETLCDSCSKYHKAFKAFADHEIVEISKISDVHLRTSSHYNTCGEHFKNIELYCKDHEKPCCFHCVTLEHRKCNEVIAIDEAAKKLRDGDAYFKLMTSFGSLTRYYNKAIDARENCLYNCQDDEKLRKDIIQLKRKELEKHLLKLEHKLFDELSFTCGSNISVLSKSKKEYEEKRKMVLHCQNLLKAGLQSNSDIQLLYDYKNLQAQKEELEKFLSENEDTKFSEVTIKMDEVIDNFTQNVSSFGSVVEKEESTLDTGITSSLLESNIFPRDDLYIQSSLPSEAKFSGVCVHDGYILLVDRYKRRLYMFEEEIDDFYKKVKLKVPEGPTSAPWDVSGSVPGHCIVTFPDSNVMADVDIGLCKVSRWIHINSPQTGIAYYGSNIITGYRANDQTADKIYIFDASGKVIREHDTCRPNYLCTDDVGRIYFANGGDHKLICMTFDFMPVFTYQHEQLRGISGITTDEEGNVYVAGFVSNNIHQLKPEGTFNRIILTEKNGINNPRGISYKRDSDLLIVLNNCGDEVSLFHLE